MTSIDEKLTVNPEVIMRDDFDDFAILFDPDTGKAFGLNPVGETIWNLLNDEITVDNIIAKLKEECIDVSNEVESEVQEFINNLLKNGLIGKGCSFVRA
ncbi:PqqD family peptide modification chaperone [bacterium]|nr:PqqD family peptide modification chaperone [bacterium]